MLKWSLFTCQTLVFGVIWSCFEPCTVLAIIFKGDLEFQNITSEETPICVFSRRKSDDLDDALMPPFLTFCSCTLLSKNTVITAKSCFIQLNWGIYIFDERNNLTSTNDTELEIKQVFENASSVYTISQIFDYERITVVVFRGDAKSEKRAATKHNLTLPELEKTKKLGRKKKNCWLFAYLTPGNIPNNRSGMLTDIWRISNRLVTIPVRVSGYNGSHCHEKYSIEELPLRNPKNMELLLCVLPKDVLFDTCATDLGAPVFCNNKLTGLISAMINRPPDGIQNQNTEISPHVPNSCHTKLKKKNLAKYIYIAENLKDPKIIYFSRKAEVHVHGKIHSGVTTPRLSIILLSIILLFLEIEN